MFQVTADTLQAYLDFDPERRRDLTNCTSWLCRLRRASSAISIEERPPERRECA